MDNIEFPERWIVSEKGELIHLGDNYVKPWGFTIKGIDEELNPVYGFVRYGESINDFLGGK